RIDASRLAIAARSRSWLGRCRLTFAANCAKLLNYENKRWDKMAILTSTGDLRGKVGNWVFQGGRYGPMRRAYVKWKKPRTESQQTRRQIFGVLTQSYQHQTQEQIQAWESAGEQVPTRTKRGIMTGQQ